MIPAQARRRKKNQAQLRRRQRGRDWEVELEAQLNEYGWAKRWPPGFKGQPWDISAMVDGIGHAIECKRIDRGNLGYSAFTANEIENLSRFEDAGGCSVVAIHRDRPETTRFVPWYAVREDVLGGDRGSIKLEDYPEELAGVKEVPHP